MARRDPCPTCGAKSRYSARYDRFLCHACKVWLDRPCGCKPEDHCPFPKSPEQPDQATLDKAEDL